MKLNENQKVTLTIGQLRKLVNESAQKSFGDERDYMAWYEIWFEVDDDDFDAKSTLITRIADEPQYDDCKEYAERICDKLNKAITSTDTVGRFIIKTIPPNKK